MPESTEVPVIDRPAPPKRTKAPAPTPEPTPPPPPEPRSEPLPMPQLPDELKQVDVNVASEKQTIVGDGRQEQEKLEQAGRLDARKRMTEEREGNLGWEKKFSIKRLGKRIWQDGIHQRALYAREKATAQQMMAEGGLQSDIPYEFQRQIRKAAEQQVETNHTGEKGVKKLGTRAKDFLKQATLAQRELHRQEVATMKNLRLGLQYHRNPDALNAIQNADEKYQAQRAVSFVTKSENQALFKAYQDVLTGDFQASEGLARRLSADLGDDALRSAIGEKKGEGKVAITGDFRAFLNDEVVFPLLREGLQNGSISDASLLEARTRIREGLPQVESWRRSLGQQANSMDVSMSYAMDIVPVIQGLSSQLQGVKAQLLSGENLKTYVNELVLKANVGTLKSGAETTVNETVLERWTTRQLTNRRVMDAYRNAGTGELVHPGSYDNALEPSATRANVLNDVFKFGGGHVSAGLVAGFGFYGLQRVAGAGGRMLVPFFGGSAVAGGVRAMQERARFTREVEQHRREVAEGATFPTDAKRRQRMNEFNLPMINVRDATRPLMEGRQAIEGGNASVEDISRLLGALADRQARLGLMNTRGVDLYQTTSDTSLDAERTRMELENAKATRALRNYFDNNQHSQQLADVVSRLGIRIDPNNIVGTLTGSLSEIRRNNLVVGNSLDTNMAQAFGGSVGQGAAIDSRDRTMRDARRVAMAKQGIGTFAAAFGGGLLSQEVMANVLRGTHDLGWNGSPRPTVIEHALGIGNEPKAQHIPGGMVPPEGRPNFPHHIFKVDGAKVDVQMPNGLIPQGSHVVEQGHHFFLVNKEGKHLFGMHLDKYGQPVIDQVKGGIDLKDLHIQATTSSDGNPIPEQVKGKHGVWRQYSSDKPWQGYANDTDVPDKDELRFHTLKHGHTIALVPQNMMTSYEHGLIPEHYYVPNVEHKGDMWYDFMLGGKTENSIQVQAPSHRGILWLNPNDHDPNHTYMTGSGKRIQAGVLARMILNPDAYKGLPNGDIATELNGHEDVFNLASHGEAGVISQGTVRDGAFQSFASIHGTGHLPETLTTPGQPTYHVEIIPKEGPTHIPGRTENPIDTPLFPGLWPRRPLEAGEETTGEPLPEPPPIVEPGPYDEYPDESPYDQPYNRDGRAQEGRRPVARPVPASPDVLRPAADVMGDRERRRPAGGDRVPPDVPSPGFLPRIAEGVPEGDMERIIREQGFAMQQNLMAQDAGGETQEIFALRNAAAFLGRPLSEADRRIVTNNLDNWGPELAWQMYQERQRIQRPPQPATPPREQAPQGELAQALEGIENFAPLLRDRIQEQLRLESYAKAYFGTDRLSDELTNIVNHAQGWGDVIVELARRQGRTLSPDEARAEFVTTAQTRGSRLTPAELERIFDSPGVGYFGPFQEVTPRAPTPEARTSEAIPLETSDDLLGDMRTGLENAANEGNTRQAFTMQPQLLADYLRANTSILINNPDIDVALNDLNMTVNDDNQIQVNGVLQYKGREIPINQLLLSITDRGELQVSGRPEYDLKNLNLVERAGGPIFINSMLGRLNTRLTERLNQQVAEAGWQVRKFQITDAQMLGIEFERAAAAPTPPQPGGGPTPSPEDEAGALSDEQRRRIELSLVDELNTPVAPRDRADVARRFNEFIDSQEVTDAEQAGGLTRRELAYLYPAEIQWLANNDIDSLEQDDPTLDAQLVTQLDNIVGVYFDSESQNEQQAARNVIAKFIRDNNIDIQRGNPETNLFALIALYDRVRNITLL